MLKIRALNRESLSDEEAPIIRREAQEEIALELYNNALKLQSSGELEEGKNILSGLLKENIPQLETVGGLPSSMSTLKYSCYVNIANMYLKENNHELALDNYLIASGLDGTDVTLWHKIGQLGVKQNRFRQAAYAFSKGIECSESHWPCLDELITLLYAMSDTISCLWFIGKALILNPDYTKGLVLRQAIYKSNPATLAYYQQFNPNYVWEPTLDVSLDEGDVDFFMGKIEPLIVQIHEAEKAQGPKPLQTIPLPRALDDFTWVAYGKVVTELHQYITNQNMSHFTFIDVTRCMSQFETEEPEVIIDKNEEKVEPEPEVEEEKDLELVQERRPSQNSETNNEGQENTPIQTDNDEEQLMEEDGEETNENKQKAKSSKRKRDLLSDLQIWGWHSKRKSSKRGKTEKDLTIEDTINKLIPKTLQQNFLNESKPAEALTLYADTSPRASEPASGYFNSERERTMITDLWGRITDEYNAILLIRDFVLNLSKLWNLKWPSELIKLYLTAYDMYREHYEHPDVLSTDAVFENLRDDALATILYGELVNFAVAEDSRELHVSSIGFLQLISGWKTEWGEEFNSFFIRVYWLRTHIYRNEGLNDLAINALQLIQEIIQDDLNSLVILPNSLKCCEITNELVTRILKRLDMITSLSCIEDLYNEEKYRDVAQIIQLTFAMSEHPVCGRMGRPAQLAMLLHSLWFTNLKECFIWTEECLFEAIPQVLKRGKDQDKWEKIVEKCVLFLIEIIKMETIIIIDYLPEERRARLVESLTRIVSTLLDGEHKSKNISHITPWMVLHYVFLREEHRIQAGKKISHVKYDKKEVFTVNEELPPSIEILLLAHEFLGPKSLCVMNNGELLHFILDVVLDKLDTPILEALRDKVDIHIEQALFCLYQHPSKKNKISRHLADHNVDPLPLNWQRAFQLYDFYGPDSIPEFNSYKNVSISSDTEQLLQRIIALVPSQMDPQPHMSKISDYIQGKSTELPEPLAFSGKMRDIYYLIGDYYFKQREFNRCIKYFLMDLCIDPNRLDSWACMGLSYLSQLENKLNYCKKMKSEGEFLDKAKSAHVTFKKALELDKENIVLWIEYGSFEYMAHSFCSRIMKTESDTLSMEKFENLENQKNSFLESSGKSFEKAIQLYQPDDADTDERWLQYYILGKIAEKQQTEPEEYLRYYLIASKLLHENNAVYPEKINYYNPQHLAVEALEIHYRVHASILKYLELHEGKPISNVIGNTLKEHLEKTFFPKKSLTKPVAKPEKHKNEIEKDVKACIQDLLSRIEKSEVKDEVEKKEDSVKKDDVIMISDSDEEKVEEKKNVQEFLDKMMEETMNKTEEQEPDSDASLTSKKLEEKLEVKPKSGSETETDVRTSMDDSSSSQTSSSSSSSSSESDSDDDSSSSISSTSTETLTGNISNSEILNLVDRCIIGLEQCVIRLPQNYKALYRLAHFFFNFKPRKDMNKSKQLFLGEYVCKGGHTITGLFSERKNHNFFHGIWRIPSSEIDRPGSLSAHMSRCITLLLQILQATSDHKLLLDLSLQFRKSPDPDKIYIKDSERLQFADQAMAMCVQSLRSQIQNIGSLSGSAGQRLLQDIFKSYQRIQKSEPSKEATFSGMLTEVYKKIKKDKVPETANVLELATKFCQQSRVVEKQKRQMQTAVLRGPGVQTSPVLPTPAVVSAQTTPPVLKRPSLGRPRGRPPLPKVPGATRNARGRSPNVSYNWQKAIMEQNATYNYLKHYQDELMKQYSQTLTLSQITQLNQYFARNALAQNPMLRPGPSKPELDAALKSYNAPKKTVVVTPSPPPLQGKSKAVFSSAGYKAGYSPGYSKSSTTTSSSQIFKEPPVTKNIHATIMKERPNISITPVQSPLPLITTASFTSPVSSGKTLQEKLADKQRQLSTKQLGRNIEAEIISAPVKKTLNIPSIPASLTVSKTTTVPYKLPVDTGISISQVPVPPTTTTPETLNLDRKKLAQQSMLQKIPAGINISKVPEKRHSSDDDVIFIE